jgi:dihydrofolate reductase
MWPWPAFSASATDEVSGRMSGLPKWVFSSTLNEPLAWRNPRGLKGALADEIRALKQRRGDPRRSIGSISLMKSIMQLGLVDRLRLMVFSLVLGGTGGEPIYAGYPQAGLELIDTKVLDSRLILLDCQPVHRTHS